METSRADIGKRIKEIRNVLNLNQTKFGDAIGLSRNVLSKYEIGDAYQRAKILCNITKLGGVSLDWLITGQESQPTFINKCHLPKNKSDISPDNGSMVNGEIVSTITPGNDITKQKLIEQNNRPTAKNIFLRLIVQWMDKEYEKNEQQGLWFYEDIRDRYPSFRNFLEKKQQREGNQDKKLENLSDGTQG